MTPHRSYTKNSLTVRGDKVGTEKLTNLKVNVPMTDKQDGIWGSYYAKYLGQGIIQKNSASKVDAAPCNI